MVWEPPHLVCLASGGEANWLKERSWAERTDTILWWEVESGNQGNEVVGES
jgi:hypothetical protein